MQRIAPTTGAGHFETLLLRPFQREPYLCGAGRGGLTAPRPKDVCPWIDLRCRREAQPCAVAPIEAKALNLAENFCFPAPMKNLLRFSKAGMAYFVDRQRFSSLGHAP